ncbi:MAG: hypothetical protein PVH73_07520 [Candidatus Bathyarchaeota archaeon]
MTPVHGVGQGEWIVNYRVEDLETGELILESDFETGEINEYDSLFIGSELRVTITVNVVITATYANLKLTTNLSPSTIEDRYWQLGSQAYEFVDYNPAQHYVEFQQVAGNFTIICYGRIPVGITQEGIDGYVLHKAEELTLIKLTSPSGELLDHIKSDVLDAELAEYRSLLEKREDKLETLKDSGIAPGYIEIYGDVLAQAEAQAELGFVDEAIALLDLLVVSQEPVSSTVEVLFLPIMAGLAIALVAVGVLYLRARSNRNYVLSVIEDQIRDLEGVTLRASKLDRTISSRLESIKERLKKLIWA